MDIVKLDELYKLYRFQLLPISNKGIRVYSYTSKYFSNADIIVLNPNITESDLQVVKDQVSSLGFSATTRHYKSIEEAESNLFDGFFDIENSNKQLRRSYEDYKNKIEELIFGNYEYINSEYYDLERDVLENNGIVNRIIDDLSQKGAVLIILEAAAGFGKTSTSYEILKHYAFNSEGDKIPLFTELSRNRRASIFKYVLYDEINARFANLNLDLVHKHIIEGRIPLIIDGFDELLKSKSQDRNEDKFEDAEPMLETIKELLKGDAKIVLTTRRTAIFSDDDFFTWLDNNAQFQLCRYSISDPTISDWISPTREKELQRAGLNLKSISNPVLLAYLRNMDDTQFEKCLSDIDIIIEDYIKKLMERENERQDLNMTVDEQKTVLKIISRHFTNFDITSDSKEILEEEILKQESQLLFKVLDRFSATTRPTIDQLINKLIIHAFLDKKGESNHQIGFVNDFILGSFVGANLLEEGEAWFATERFVDFILTAYLPRSQSTKRTVYQVLNTAFLTYLDIDKQVYIDNYLFGSINRPLEYAVCSSLEFRNHFNSVGNTISTTIFSQCDFYKIDFTKELTEVKGTHFINCHFFDCTIPKDVILQNDIQFNNCSFTPDIDLEEHKDGSVAEGRDVNFSQPLVMYQRIVLGKFWPSGKERFIPHKRLVTLRSGVTPSEIAFMDEAIDSLIKSGCIIQRRGHHSLELNVREIDQIKKILGR